MSQSHLTLVPSFWVPSLGSQLLSPALGPSFGPTWPMAHRASMCCITFGTLCVASVLGNYVLHHLWESICCTTPGKLFVASPLGNYVLHHPWKTMCCITPGKLCVALALGNYVLHQPWADRAHGPLGPWPSPALGAAGITPGKYPALDGLIGKYIYIYIDFFEVYIQSRSLTVSQSHSLTVSQSRSVTVSQSHNYTTIRRSTPGKLCSELRILNSEF